MWKRQRWELGTGERWIDRKQRQSAIELQLICRDLICARPAAIVLPLALRAILATNCRTFIFVFCQMQRN